MIKSFGAVLAAVSCAALLTACSGGGGGGGGIATGPSTPSTPSGPLTPATPYSPGAAPASTRPTGCITAVCLTVSGGFAGPSTQVLLSGSTITSAIDNSQSQTLVNVVVNPGSTSATTDDSYTVKYNLHGTTYTQVFSNPVARTDALGNLAGTQVTSSGLVNNFALFNVASALSGSLDYVQIAAYDRSTLTGAEDVFIVYGRQTSPADMPTSGSATYKGGTRGLYITTAGETLQTASDITMSTNFASGAISGSTANFRVMNITTGALVARNEDLNFAFNANITSGSPVFSGTASSSLSTGAGGLGLSGNVEGAFFGAAGQAPDEAGLVYKLGTPLTTNFLMGGAALGKQ